MNGALLKKIAVVTMLVDHLGAAFFIIYTSGYDGTAAFGGADVMYQLLRIIGRTAFPIFCFLIVEGFFFTRSRWKYLLRLFLFALLSEVPFDLAFHDKVWDMSMQNVFFTLFLGLLALMALDMGRQAMEACNSKFSPKVVASGVGTLLCVAAAYFGRTDYDVSGVFLILIFYLFRESRGLACLCGYLCMLHEMWCFPAFVLLYFYNGAKGKGSKYFYYVFYPAHLVLLALFRMLCLK